MAEVKWIKITTGMFDDEKIDFIESLPEADTILICWIKLLTIAGKANMSGHIMLTDTIPYTSDMLSHKFKRPLNTVKMALETFARLGMITMEEGQPIYINNWEKHQNIDGMERIREQNRLRKQRQRENEKLLLLNNPPNNSSQNMSRDSHVEITCDKRESHATDIDIDNNTLRRKRVYDADSVFLKGAIYLRDRILAWKPNARIPKDLNAWADEVRKMNELDKRSLEDIKRVIDFATSDSFWQANILSAKKLREKFDTLEAKAKTPVGGRRQSAPEPKRSYQDNSALEKARAMYGVSAGGIS